MRSVARCLALAISLHVAVARLFHSLPEDTYAFPKFRVAFLNSLPVLNETADRWLKDGLYGGELEFLDQLQGHSIYSTPLERKGIEDGYSQGEASPAYASGMSNDFTLELMKLGPRDSYVCLIPKPLDNVPSSAEEQPDAELTPAGSWALLQSLTGKCLYHRHGWFTYSYCHNHEIRQFKELVPQTPRLAVSYVPEEDPEWESYTLGRAPTQPTPGADLTIADQNAHAANLELAKNAGSRYLVQRWGDGTLCDKTGKPREVEVQFHCSMITTDSILFVKEAKTCSYVLVINTPRLCGEPGFRSKHDTADEAAIRCRQVVDTLPLEPLDIPTTDYPVKGPQPKKSDLPAAAPAEETDSIDDKAEKDAKQEAVVSDLLRQTIEALMKRKGVKLGEATEVVIQLEEGDENEELSNKLISALRDVGYEVRGAEFVDFEMEEDMSGKKDGKEEKKPKPKKPTEDFARYEL